MRGIIVGLVLGALSLSGCATTEEQTAATPLPGALQTLAKLEREAAPAAAFKTFAETTAAAADGLAADPMQSLGLRRVAASAYRQAEAFAEAGAQASQGLAACPAGATGDVARTCAALAVIRDGAVSLEAAALVQKTAATANPTRAPNPAVSLDGWKGLRDGVIVFETATRDEWPKAKARLTDFAPEAERPPLAEAVRAQRAGAVCRMLKVTASSPAWAPAAEDADGAVKLETMRSYRNVLVAAADDVLGARPAACEGGDRLQGCIVAAQSELAKKCPTS